MAEETLRSRLKAITEFTGEVLWPKRLNGAVGRLLGALSLLALARYAFDFGLSTAATKVFQYYDGLLRVLLGWIDPYLRPWIASLFAKLKLHIAFNQYWRHVFVVLQMLFVRDAGVAYSSGRRVVGTVRLMVGFVVAVPVSVLAAVRIPGAPNLVSNLVFATLPTAGIYVYDVLMYCHSAVFQLDFVNAAEGASGRTRREFFRAALYRANLRLALGLSVSYAAFLLPAVRNATAPAGGLVAIGLATIANASYWLWRGGKFATKEAKLGNSWIASFRKSEAGRFGIAVTGVLVWAAVFASLNAGMQQLGL